MQQRNKNNSSSSGWYLFPVPVRVGGWVGPRWRARETDNKRWRTHCIWWPSRGSLEIPTAGTVTFCRTSSATSVLRHCRMTWWRCRHSRCSRSSTCRHHITHITDDACWFQHGTNYIIQLHVISLTITHHSPFTDSSTRGNRLIVAR